MANPQTPINVVSFVKALDPQVQEHYSTEYKALEPMLDYFYKIDDQVIYNRVVQGYTGLRGNVPTVVPGGTYQETANLPGYATTFTPEKVGDLVPIQDEVIRYAVNASKEVLNISKMNARAMAETLEKSAAETFNKSQNTAFTSYGDLKPLGSTQHSSPDSTVGAQSNASATGIVFSESNLETGMLALERQLTDSGNPFAGYADCLIVPPALRKQAYIVTQSEKRSGTANNDANAYRGGAQMSKGLQIEDVIVWRYLDAQLGGSNTRWFLMNKENAGLRWFWGFKPKYEMLENEGNKNDVVYYKKSAEWSKGWIDWRGFYVSAGDGASYTD